MTTQSLRPLARPLVAGLVACSIGPFAWGADSMSKASIEKEAFGVTADGIAVERYTLQNAQGMKVRIITYGATVTELWVPDRTGKLEDVVLGFDNHAQYETQSPYFGCTVGRVAFRIAGAEFPLGGKTYRLTLNSGRHHLHGGTKGLSKVVWKAADIPDDHSPAVKLTYRSPDGDQGYPGNLDLSVTYTLTDQNGLKIEYQAATDRATPVNLTHHSYFNLAGHASGDVLRHVLRLEAARYTPTDEAMTPSGQIAPVQGTPLDFTSPAAVGARIQSTPGGYDLSYLIDRSDRSDRTDRRSSLVRAAALSEPSSGRVMEVLTTAPAIILYTGNALDGSLKGKQGAIYRKHAGLCLETGHLPDSVHHADFPSVILHPGQPYRQTCIYQFSVK